MTCSYTDLFAPSSLLGAAPTLPTLFPYPTLFRSLHAPRRPYPAPAPCDRPARRGEDGMAASDRARPPPGTRDPASDRSEEHMSELQSPCNLVCRLLLEKKKKSTRHRMNSWTKCRN